MNFKIGDIILTTSYSGRFKFINEVVSVDKDCLQVKQLAAINGSCDANGEIFFYPHNNIACTHQLMTDELKLELLLNLKLVTLY